MGHRGALCHQKLLLIWSRCPVIAKRPGDALFPIIYPHYQMANGPSGKDLYDDLQCVVVAVE